MIALAYYIDFNLCRASSYKKETIFFVYLAKLKNNKNLTNSIEFAKIGLRQMMFWTFFKMRACMKSAPSHENNVKFLMRVINYTN